MSGSIQTFCMGCTDEKCDFKTMPMYRRPLGDEDILIDMKYCGICHTDLHNATGHTAALGLKRYPCVSGHELTGVLGTNYDMIESHPVLFATPPCLLPLSLTHLLCFVSYSPGYTTKMVVHERFAIIIPKEYPMQYADPVMCAGVTLFDPFRRYKTTKETCVSIVGLSGLGQMGVKIAKTMGCVVTVVSLSVIKQIGASSFV